MILNGEGVPETVMEKGEAEAVEQADYTETDKSAGGVFSPPFPEDK